MTTTALGSATDPPRVAYALSRSVGGAVVRNRVRRRLHAIVRENRDLLRSGHGYLVRPARKAATATHEELASAFRAVIGAFRNGTSS